MCPGPQAAPRPDVDLRPSMVRRYSTKTLACYQARLAHYQHWCRTHGYQHGTDTITPPKLVEYVHDQISRWNETHDPSDITDYPR
jgi:site-specific recombinase XerD